MYELVGSFVYLAIPPTKKLGLLKRENLNDRFGLTKEWLRYYLKDYRKWHMR